ncbi:helix-turn-helix transcriptional regulator [Alkalibacillus aidingensis]|uniref:helix-turn-helix transcriptional regulator n=1 Tax=Alkalibacillus aidingensis TaxID=2747607 RepID=UPI0016600D6A|nr:helix-turn-helix domain-containing protein [Alkalibacillus aidingensis]
MKREDVQKVLSPKFKLVRIEQELTQDEMSRILGISKKSLIQIEKGRILASWTVLVAFVALFNESALLKQTLGERNPVELIQSVGRTSIRLDIDRSSTYFHQFWETIDERKGLQLQRHHFFKHYRIIDQGLITHFRSTDIDETQNIFLDLIKKRWP